MMEIPAWRGGSREGPGEVALEPGLLVWRY